MKEKKLTPEQEKKISEIKKEFEEKISAVEFSQKEYSKGVYVLDNGICEPFDSIWEWYKGEIKAVIGS